MFCSVPALVLELIFDEDFNNVFLHAMIGVSLAEEGSKFILYYNYKKDDFNEPYDGIVYAVLLVWDLH